MITPQTTVAELLKLYPNGLVLFASGDIHHLVFFSPSLAQIATTYHLPPTGGCFVVTSPEQVETPMDEARRWLANLKTSPDPEA